MRKTMLKLAVFLIGAHLLLGAILLGITATHGINDQDASFAVAILFRQLNLPAVWALSSLGAGRSLESQIILILFVGIVQWAGLACVIAAIYRALRAGFCMVAGRSRVTSEPEAPTSTQPHP